MSNIIIDSVDLAILKKISEDSTCRTKELCRLGLSRSSTTRRLKRLKENKYILVERNGHLKMLSVKGREVLDGDFYPTLATGS